jgi:tetratricopeptide (TPR) repeat protein
MNKQEFIDYLKSPDSLSVESIAPLEQLVRDYPYFQTADMLYALNLSKENNIKFSDQLRLASAYAPDRKVLKQLIQSIHVFTKGEKTDQGTKDDEVIALGNDDLLFNEESIQLEDEDLNLPHLIDIFQHELDKITRISKDSSEYRHLQKLAGKLESLLEEHIQLKQTPPDHYFEEYNLSHLKESDAKEDKPISGSDLIDKFINENPRIVPEPQAGFFDPVDFAKQSLIDNDEIVSETLAEIFYRQGNLAKAIKIYKKLSLLNPEKRFYFAGRIEKIRKEIK